VTKREEEGEGEGEGRGERDYDGEAKGLYGSAFPRTPSLSRTHKYNSINA